MVDLQDTLREEAVPEDIDHHLEVVQQLVELLNLLLKQVVIR